MGICVCYFRLCNKEKNNSHDIFELVLLFIDCLVSQTLTLNIHRLTPITKVLCSCKWVQHIMHSYKAAQVSTHKADGKSNQAAEEDDVSAGSWNG